LRRLALLLEYDGTPYAGSQLQSNGPSIQAELERSIREMTGSFSRVAFAGRTDAGVHALGQVVAYDTETVYGCEEFVGGLNVRLPATIAARAAREVEVGFDPRRRAVARWYRYCIVDSPTRAPLQRERAWQVATSLDVRSMQEAANLLIGEHDLAGFASPEAARASTRREVHHLRIRRRGRELTIDIRANAFLMHQVRRTVAALVDVGTGRLGISELGRHLREAQPGSYERTAPSHGLCLMSVRYVPTLFPPLYDEEREQE
jgi:tRNA pseudouridine38-40 synthase